MLTKALSRNLFVSISALLASISVLFVPAWRVSASPDLRPLRLEDLFEIQRIDRVAASPNGDVVAVVIQRPAKAGEIYGRTSYEVDPSRNDIVMVSTTTGVANPLTNGAAMAAGYWCATWSPDGRRLAFLSTQPEGDEPRGGDNVHLYVWDSVSGQHRLGNEAVMTQSRYGSPMYQLDLRGGATGSSTPLTCNDSGEENAPFLWLDSTNLLVATLPPGKASGLIDQYARSQRQKENDALRLRAGRQSTGEAVGSGRAATAPADSEKAIIKLINAGTGTQRVIATVPAYPFRGPLSISVAPDHRRLAILAPVAALRPKADEAFPKYWDDGWTVKRRLGFADVQSVQSFKWRDLPKDVELPLAFFGWSPDSKSVAFTGRADGVTAQASFAIADFDRAEVKLYAEASPIEDQIKPSPFSERQVLWASPSQILMHRQPQGGAEAGWYVLDLKGHFDKIQSIGKSELAGFRRSITGDFIAVQDGHLVQLDVAAQKLKKVGGATGISRIVWPQNPDTATDRLLVSRGGGLQWISAQGRTLSGVFATSGPDFSIKDAAPKPQLLIVQESGKRGERLEIIAGKKSREERRGVLEINAHLATVEWGQTKTVDYKNADGVDLKAVMLLPPGYDARKTYPALFWLYPGYTVDDPDHDFWIDPFLPGIYNMHLYAARGYVVVIPSIPLPSRSQRQDVYAKIAGSIMPLANKIVSLRIADPERMGIFGQSYGGYAVYALVTQTNRFKAAVAIDGITDLVDFFGQFDVTSWGFPGIGHEKSDNWAEVDLYGLQAPPSKILNEYRSNSPLSHVDRVETPLLMLHGGADIRGDEAQAEKFFYALYSMGKTARLVRYGGENHSLALSPANVASAFDETMAWFDEYLSADRPQ